MIEALSLGRPVIAWNYGGAAESVGELFPDGLVAVGDEQALAETTEVAAQTIAAAFTKYLRARADAATDLKCLRSYWMLIS